MRLPVMPPLSPMLAKAAGELPRSPGMSFEPKWDGFRCVIFRDGEEVVLGSRSGKDLARYFPELTELLRRVLPMRCVLDGELIVIRDDPRSGFRLEFDALTARIHPAASRIATLATSVPASFVAFDLLALDDRDLTGERAGVRREELRSLLSDRHQPGAVAAGRSELYLTPSTTDPDLAERWFAEFEGAGLDGVVAKHQDLLYQPGKRAMLKIKHSRSVEAVVAGYRLHSSGGVGSLLLGLFDNDGRLQHVGVASSFTAARRAELLEQLEVLRTDGPHPWTGEDDAVRAPGEVNRWNANKNLSFVPIRLELVAEVGYDHTENTVTPLPRFRHTTSLLRWRPDRTPQSCLLGQLFSPVRYDLADVLGGDGGSKR